MTLTHVLCAIGALLILWLTLEFLMLWRLVFDIQTRRIRLRQAIGLMRWLRWHVQAAIDRRRAQRRKAITQLSHVRRWGSALPEAMIVLNAKDHIVWSNPRAAELLAIQRNARGSSIAQHLPENWLRWIESTDFDRVTEFTSPLHADRTLWTKLRGVGQAERVLLVRDSTQLSRAANVRKDFVANVSHELRTPLTVMNGYLDAIEPEDIPEFAEPFRQMREQGQRMARIVEDLLTLARLERDEVNPRTPDDLLLMRSLLVQLQTEAQALSGGKHQIELDAGVTLNIMGRESDLRSAFSNLVSNAVRYTPAGGVIAISWRWHADGAVFEVRDSGLGIPAEHIPRLTERFYRVSNSRSRESGGTGLGLAIVHHVLLAHQGRLNIKSELGKGSCFGCVLPRARLRASDVGA